MEVLPGIFRRTLAHCPEVMMVRFFLKAGAKIPLHDHPAAQNGYVVSGRVKFFTDEEGGGFVAAPGDGYVFGPSEPHGADILEDSVVVEAFAPSRPEYVDE
ncbi:MAG: cupin domain-containing protein [Promethearchaeota archaeon]